MPNFVAAESRHIQDSYSAQLLNLEQEVLNLERFLRNRKTMLQNAIDCE